MILLFPDVLEPLLATGNCKDIPSIFQRFLKTSLHINSWYEEDVFDPSTKAYKSIRYTRVKHKRVQSMMTDKFMVPGANGEPVKWITQWDMALSQFSFIGLAILHPSRSGFIAASRQELELINYYWRVLGHLMGIRDEFNVCHFDNHEDTVELNRLIMEHGYKATFRETPFPQGIEMCKALCIAFSYFTPQVSFNSMVHWWKDEWSLVVGDRLEPLTLHDQILYSWTYIQFTYILRYNFTIKLMNMVHSKLFELRLKNKDQEYKRLKAKYADNPKYTFYSDRVQYPVNSKRDIKSTTADQQAEDHQFSFFAPFHLVILLIGLAALLGYFIGK